jgi:hypothetical protein
VSIDRDTLMRELTNRPLLDYSPIRGPRPLSYLEATDVADLVFGPERPEAGEGPPSWSMNDVLGAFGRPPVEGGDGR